MRKHIEATSLYAAAFFFPLTIQSLLPHVASAFHIHRGIVIFQAIHAKPQWFELNLTIMTLDSNQGKNSCWETSCTPDLVLNMICQAAHSKQVSVKPGMDMALLSGNRGCEMAAAKLL